jgi:hypothetical protein
MRISVGQALTPMRRLTVTAGCPHREVFVRGESTRRGDVIVHHAARRRCGYRSGFSRRNPRPRCHWDLGAKRRSRGSCSPRSSGYLVVTRTAEQADTKCRFGGSGAERLRLGQRRVHGRRGQHRHQRIRKSTVHGRGGYGAGVRRRKWSAAGCSAYARGTGCEGCPGPPRRCAIG